MKKKRKKYIIGNLKMNPSSKKEMEKLFSGSQKLVAKHSSVVSVSALPFIYLDKGVSLSKSLKVSAQDVSAFKNGAYTGEVSAGQLKDIKVSYCIVGHSERREAGESDRDVALKIQLLLKAGIIPIVCIGEKERDLQGLYIKNIRLQIRQSLEGVPKSKLKTIIYAYEPLWAIGKDAERPATTEEAGEMIRVIRRELADIAGVPTGKNAVMLYGGSVKRTTAKELLMEDGIDGFLIGGASLDAQHFADISHIAHTLK
ncbi:MAG: triosephosphate isomerase [Flavobacteriaceae bacterium]|jgi:triosephosphate isomerase